MYVCVFNSIYILYDIMYIIYVINLLITHVVESKVANVFEPCGILRCCEAGLVGNELANVFDT